MTSYLHHNFVFLLVATYVTTMITLIVTWIFFVNRGDRMQLREVVIDLIREIDPKCRIQPKRNSSKHVCFFLTISPPGTAIELYFDGGRNRFELYDAKTRTSLDRKTIGQGIDLNETSISLWIMDTLYPDNTSVEPPV